MAAAEYVVRPVKLRLVDSPGDGRRVDDRDAVRQILFETLRDLREKCDDLNAIPTGAFYASTFRVWIVFLEKALRKRDGASGHSRH